MKAGRFLISAVVTITAFLLTSCSKPANWPQFRGPMANMAAEGSKLPDDWDTKKGIAWTYDISGNGFSSPVIWGDRVFMTAAFPEKVNPAPEMSPGRPNPPQPQNGQRPGPGGRPDQGPRPGQRPADPGPQENDTSFRAEVYRWEVVCLDLNTGKELWKKTAFHGSPSVAKHQMSSYACETPVTDGRRVYAYFGMTGLFCYDFEGNMIWQTSLGSYRTQNNWGTGSSPVIWNGTIFVLCDNEENSFIAAIDAATGKEKWRTAREEKTTYSTPYIWTNKTRTELVACGKTIRSYDPATGKVLWELKARGEQAIPSPVGDKEMVYTGVQGSGEKKGEFYAIKAGAEGNITPPDSVSLNNWIVWRTTDSGLGSGSPLLYEGLIYNVGGRGEIKVLSAADGNQVYFKKINGMGTAWASSWVAGGKVFICDEKGTTRILKAGSSFEQFGENKLDDKIWASAAISGNKLILRGEKKVWCIAD